MFYFFFESRNNKDDPVVIWLTGGPGCSSDLALFYENGPFQFSGDNNNFSLVWNEYGWDAVPINSHTYMIIFFLSVGLELDTSEFTTYLFYVHILFFLYCRHQILYL
jgi:hypothetical protein